MPNNVQGERNEVYFNCRSHYYQNLFEHSRGAASFGCAEQSEAMDSGVSLPS